MKKIVVAGASTYGVKNAGDDAMFRNLINGIKKRIPNSQITFLARHPDKDFDNFFGIKSIKNIEHDSKKQSLGRWFCGFNPGDSTEHLERIRKAIEECDLIIIGGNSFMEVSGSSFLRGVVSYSATLATWARLFQKPYALYGVAAHPLKNDITKQLARFLCGNANIVTVREEFTKQQLLDAGVNDANIQVFADPAFGIDPVSDRDKALNILKNENIQLNSQKIIGIAFRHMYWVWNEKEFEHYSIKMANLCDFMIENFGAELLFIPNCTYNVDTKYEDDRVIAELVRNKMKRPEKAHLIRNEYNLTETLSLYQLLDMLLSNRRHSCIFGAIHNVPFIAMSTGHMWHFKPFVKALSIPGQAVSFTEDSLNSLKSEIRETWKNRVTLSQKISKAVPFLKEKARKQVDVILDTIDMPIKLEGK